MTIVAVNTFQTSKLATTCGDGRGGIFQFQRCDASFFLKYIIPALRRIYQGTVTYKIWDALQPEASWVVSAMLML